MWDQKCIIWVFLDYILKSYCHIWNQHPQICLTAKFYKEKRMPKFSTKYPLFKYFWPRLYQNYCHSRTQHHQIGEIVKFREKKKLLKFGTTNALFGYFWIFKKLLWHSKFSTVKFDYLQFFAIKQKWPNLGPKMPYLGIFGLAFKKTIVIFKISALKLV